MSPQEGKFLENVKIWDSYGQFLLEISQLGTETSMLTLHVTKIICIPEECSSPLLYETSL